MKRLCALLLLISLLLPLCLAAASQPSHPTLGLGSTGEEVIRLQDRLRETGFSNGLSDGKYGQGTQQAVTRLQQALRQQGHALAVDGVAGPKTLSLLYDDKVMQPFLDLGLGASGQRVIALQNRLIDLKFLDGKADGAFGQQTQAALTAFQKHLLAQGAMDLTIMGTADAATRAYLAPGADLSAFQIIAPEFFDDSRPEGLNGQYINSKACLLVEAGSGKILFAKGEEERLYPASTTKIMTLLLALEHGKLDEVVTLPASTSKVPKDSSLVPVYPGEKMPLRDLLYGLMLRSGNDAANAIAEICGGSIPAFVEMMNQKAASLGMKDTHFTNPHGYHDKDHYTTARDLATLGLYAMANPSLVEISSAREYTLQATSKRGPLLIRDHTELLDPLSPAYYPPAYGIKSGYHSQAGFCYVGAASHGETRLLAVILASRTRNQAWQDMARLFAFGFEKVN